MKVENLMTSPVFTCSPKDTLHRAVRYMWEQDIGTVVVTNDDHEVVGMLTDRDVAMSAYLRGLKLAEIHVEDAMSRTAHCCEVGDDIQRAEALMQEKKVRRVPVRDADGRLAGIISLNDLSLAQGRRRALSDKEIARTLRAVSEPRRRLIPEAR